MKFFKRYTSPTISITDLIMLGRQLEDDETISLDALQSRDRHFGLAFHGKPHTVQLKHWLNELQGSSDHRSSPFGLWFFLSGGLLGVLSIIGLLMPGIEQPVNILLFLVVFIGTQLGLLLLTFLLIFSDYRDSILQGINPARCLVLRDIQKVSDRIHWNKLAGVPGWATLRYGQIAAVAFNLAAITTFLIILTFSDRSFGWSSTLNIGSDALHQFTHWTSLPWSWLIPEATVDLQTISQTRFQSLQTHFSADQVDAMRSWWPFLLACMFTYGFLPRAILLIASSLNYHRKLKETFLNYPGAHAVLARMNAPIIHTQNQKQSQPDNPARLTNCSTAKLPDSSALVVDWVNALETAESRELLQTLGFDSSQSLLSGLDLTLDKKILAELNQNSENNIVFAVKSWEPPLAELQDFMAELNTNKKITILLLPLSGKTIEKHALVSWQQFAQNFSGVHFKVMPQIALASSLEESS